MAMVMRANQRPGDLGGHVSSFSSAATLYDVGFNYFFHGGDEKRESDLVYFQGILHRASMHAPSSKAVSTRKISINTARKSMALACLPIRTPG